jgi:phytoene synthase
MSNKIQFQHSKEAIQGGSKSFRLASLILDQKSKVGAYSLYRWCRYCDDVIDQSAQGETDLALAGLMVQTEKALAGEPFPDSSPFSGLRSLAVDFKISSPYFFELLEGFNMDVTNFKFDNFEDLKKYCYHVAGVVGLMMSQILKASDERAPLCADYLGRAMQLTNISRDIAEDFSLKRIYIPGDWLIEASVPPAELMNPIYQDKVFALVLRLLESADQFYLEGRKGIEFLPFRAGWSITVASFLYQGIGLKIRKQGSRALLGRTVLSLSEKITYVVLGSLYFLRGRFQTALFGFKERSI